MQSLDTFWQRPPWHDGKNKHRLGLRPIDLDELWIADDALLANKQAQLEARYDAVVATSPEYSQVDFELPELSNLPSRFPDWIANVGWQVAEDLCLLDIEQDNRLVAGCLTAPSYWSLREKLGLPLLQVHEPVHGMNKKIGARIDRFLQQMPLLRPFRRENWLVHAEADYFRPAPSLIGELPTSPDNWHFRSERQTLLRLDARFVLFVIGIVFAPASKLAAYPGALDALRRSLRAMDDHEIEHFGGLEKYRRVADYVELLHSTPTDLD